MPPASTPSRPDRHRAYAATAIGATVLAAAMALYQGSQIAAAGDPVPWSALVTGQAIDWLLTLPLVPIVLRLTWRMPVAGPRWFPALMVHIAACAALALAKMIALVLIGEAARAAGWPFIDSVSASFEQNVLAIGGLACVVHLIRATTNTALPVEPARPDHFTVRDPRGYRLVRAEDIIWAEAQGNYAQLHTPSGRHLIRSTMAALETTLDPARFVRVHRRAIVNARHIERIDRDPNGGYTLSLADGASLRGGRSYGDRIAGLIG